VLSSAQLSAHENFFLKNTTSGKRLIFNTSRLLSTCSSATLAQPLRKGGFSIPKLYYGYKWQVKNVVKVKMHTKNAAAALIFAKKFVYLEKKV
jgi:hypothetical protein